MIFLSKKFVCRCMYVKCWILCYSKIRTTVAILHLLYTHTGIPIPIVVISATVAHDHYGTDKM